MHRARPRRLAALAVAVPLLAGAESLPPLEELMDPATFEAAGLDRLSAAERDTLRAWLEAWREGRATVPAPPAVLPEAAEAPEAPTAPEPRTPVAEAAPGGAVATEPVPVVAEETIRQIVREEVRAELREEVRAELEAEEAEEEAERSGWRGLFGGGGEEREASPDGFTTRIDGAFSGWDGDTLFRLQNGQVWQQRREDVFFHEARDPEVILRRNRFGFWSMEVPEAGRTVLVKRVR